MSRQRSCVRTGARPYAPWGGLEAILYYPTEADALAQSNLHHTVAYAFDLEGHLTSTSDSDPGLGFSGPLYTADPTTGYDALGRLHQLTVHFPATGAPRTLASRYNRFGEREQLDLAQGSEILSHIWTYDAMGRLDLATLPGSATPIDFTPFADDTLDRITRPSGTTTDYTYFAQGPIQSITVKAAGTTQIQRLAYAIDAVQNITSQSEQHATSDPTGAYVYGYDAANRLTSATYPAAYGFTGNQAYVYDPAGNREDPVDASLYAYDANNRLTASPGILVLHVRRRRQPDGKDGGDDWLRLHESAAQLQQQHQRRELRLRPVRPKDPQERERRHHLVPVGRRSVAGGVRRLGSPHGALRLRGRLRSDPGRVQGRGRRGRLRRAQRSSRHTEAAHGLHRRRCVARGARGVWQGARR